MKQWIMTHPNDFSNVKLIANPVKSFVIQETFSETETTVRCRLDSSFIDINKGVWQVAVSNVLLFNDSQQVINTVFNLTTNLTYTCQINDHQPVTTNECIASFQIRCQSGDFELYSPNTLTFFTVQEHSNEYFALSLTKSKLWPQNSSYQVKAEIRLLFQRMK